MLSPVTAVEERAHRLAWHALAAGARVALGARDCVPPWTVVESAAVVDAARHLARGQQVEPILLAGLHALGISAPPARPHVQLGALHAVRTTRSVVHHALARAGVPHVFMKGAAVEDTLWGGQGWRGCLDVDVLVEPAHDTVARGVLSAAGWKMQLPPEHRATALTGKERVFLPAEGAVDHMPVDLHVAPLNAPFHVDTAALIRRAARGLTTGGTWVPVPRPADALWLLAGNLAGDRFIPRFKLALDAWALLQAHPGALDDAVTGARAAGCTWALWALLQLVSVRLLGAVPAHAMEETAPPVLVRPLLAELAGVTGVPPRIRRRWARVFMLDWPWSQRWTHAPRAVGRWAALRAADHLLR